MCKGSRITQWLCLVKMVIADGPCVITAIDLDTGGSIICYEIIIDTAIGDHTAVVVYSHTGCRADREHTDRRVTARCSMYP